MSTPLHGGEPRRFCPVSARCTHFLIRVCPRAECLDGTPRRAKNRCAGGTVS